MKINKEEFLNILFAIMKDNDVNIMNLNDITEIIVTIYSSKEFIVLMDTLEIHDMIVDDVLSNDYVKNINKEGFIEFDLDGDEIDEIISKYETISSLITKAINKMIVKRYIEQKSEGKIVFKYDDPNGTYDLPYISNAMNECETQIYTDGTIAENIMKKEYGVYNKSRNVKVENATYTIMADIQNNKVKAVEIRGLFVGDYMFMTNEAENILLRQTSGYDEVDKEKPKIYKFKKH